LAYDIILQVLLVLAVAVLTGEVFEQFGFPSVAGELLSGMLLGPTVFGFVMSTSQTQAISSIALFFVVFLIGFEMKTSMVRKQLLSAMIISTTSFVMPFVFATGLALLILPFGSESDTLAALAISVPSISIISILVIEYDLLEKKSGQLIIASVTVTDILAFLILAAITRSAEATFVVLANTAIFIIAFVAVDWLLNSRPQALRVAIGKGAALVKREEISFAIVLICGLFTAALLEAIGVSYIIGAFLAGMIIHDGLIGRKHFREIANTLARMNRAFFIPLFFGFAGVEANFSLDHLSLLAPLGALIAVSIIPAYALTYRVAKRFLRDSGNSRQVALVMGGRGAVGIVIASVALGDGLIDNTAYSLVVLGTLIVSLLVPVLAGRKGLEADQSVSV